MTERPPVFGIDVDPETRCGHYRGPTDVIALRFKCCDRWYPCFECHAALTDHFPQVWSASDAGVEGVLCGKCGHQLTIAEYVGCESRCPACGAAFNPGCRHHWHLYFEPP